MEGVAHMVKRSGVKLSQWNMEHFGNVQRNLAAAQNRLLLAKNSNPELLHTKDILKAKEDVNIWIEREEMMWK